MKQKPKLIVNKKQGKRYIEVDGKKYLIKSQRTNEQILDMMVKTLKAMAKEKRKRKKRKTTRKIIKQHIIGGPPIIKGVMDENQKSVIPTRTNFNEQDFIKALEMRYKINLEDQYNKIINHKTKLLDTKEQKLIENVKEKEKLLDDNEKKYKEKINQQQKLLENGELKENKFLEQIGIYEKIIDDNNKIEQKLLRDIDKTKLLLEDKEKEIIKYNENKSGGYLTPEQLNKIKEEFKIIQDEKDNLENIISQGRKSYAQLLKDNKKAQEKMSDLSQKLKEVDESKKKIEQETKLEQEKFNTFERETQKKIQELKDKEIEADNKIKDAEEKIKESEKKVLISKKKEDEAMNEAIIADKIRVEGEKELLKLQNRVLSTQHSQNYNNIYSWMKNNNRNLYDEGEKIKTYLYNLIPKNNRHKTKKDFNSIFNTITNEFDLKTKNATIDYIISNLENDGLLGKVLEKVSTLDTYKWVLPSSLDDDDIEFDLGQLETEPNPTGVQQSQFIEQGLPPPQLKEKEKKEDTKEMKKSESLDSLEEVEEQKNKAILGEGKVNGEGGLYNYEIEKMMKKYPKFKGVFAINQLHSIPVNKKDSEFSFIMNTQPSPKSGHWIGVLVKEDRIEYYDSFADQPKITFLKNIKRILKKWKPNNLYQFKVNSVKSQKVDSTNCGYFAMKFLVDRYDGKSFKESTRFKAIEDSMKGEKEIEKFKKTIKAFGYVRPN